MTLPTHILVGLIIGRITGNYPAALTGSLVIDLDHTLSYFKHGILFQPRKLFRAVLEDTDPWDDQRNYLHGIFGWLALSLLVSLINLKFGLVFAIAYFCHLILDALDNSAFYPFFPFKKVASLGYIKYSSKQEIVLSACLAVILGTLFIF